MGSSILSGDSPNPVAQSTRVYIRHDAKAGELHPT